MPPKAKAKPTMRIEYNDEALRRANGKQVVYRDFGKYATTKLIQGASNDVSRRYGANNTIYMTAHYVNLPLFGNTFKPGDGYKAFGKVKYWDPKKRYEHGESSKNRSAKELKESWETKLFDDYSPDNPQVHIDMFTFVVVPLPAGGAGERNDCLFECIYDFFNGNLPPTLRCPAQLKKALKLDRYAMVPVKLFPEVEKLYTMRITLTGDDAYDKGGDYKGMEIVIEDNHYTLKNPPPLKKRLLWNWKDSRKETALVVVDGKVKEVTDQKLFVAIRKWNPLFSARMAGPTDGKNGKSLAEQWKAWDQECKELKEYGVDMHKTPKHTDAAMRELTLLAKDLRFEPLPFTQQQWISDAIMGGVIYAEKGFEGDVSGYDINSSYPSLLPKHPFPNGPGTMQVMKGKSKTADGRDYWPFGIYRLAKPLPQHDGKVRFWRTHGEPMYTFYDLQSYEEYTGKVPELAQDGKDNALIWGPKQRIHGALIFKDFVDKWFGLKCQKVISAKTILTCIWGALCEKHRETKVYNVGDEVHGVIIGAMSTGNGKITVSTRPSGNIFKGPLPALSCFMLSLARYKLGQMLAKVCTADCRVVRVHTDGFLLTKPLPAGETSKHLGGLKFEPDKSGKFRVNNACSVVKVE